MKVMHVGQQVRATHGLTSSRPSGWIISRGAHGVVTKVKNSDPMLYSAEFQVFDGVARVVTVKGISNRDIMPLVPAQRVPEPSYDLVS
jgi:hypothetical protein